MPGLVPGIHVLAAVKKGRRGWPGRSPAMTDGWAPLSNQSNFTSIEITPVSTPNVSSRAPRRNNSLAFETIFRFACRHPETFAGYQFAQRSAKAQSPGACHAE